MRIAILLALFALGPTGKPYQGVTGTGATAWTPPDPPAGDFAIDSTTSLQQTTTSASVAVTVTPAIPSGSVVVALVAFGGTNASDTVSGSTLGSFTNQRRTTNGGQSAIFTFVATSGASAGEVITYNCGSTGLYPAIAVVVISGASSTFVTGTATGNGSAVSITTATGVSGSYLLAAVQNFATWSATVDGNHTAIINADTSSGDHNLLWRKTTVTTATGTAITTSNNANNTWSGSAIEIRPQ